MFIVIDNCWYIIIYMNQDRDELENLWDNLLSRNPEQIIEAFTPLDELHQQNVHDHLIRMAEDPGWHPEQRRSAQSALAALSGRGIRNAID